MKIRPLVGLGGVLIAAVTAEFNDQVSAVALTDISGGFGLSHDAGTWFASLYVSAEVVGMALSPWLAVTFTLRHFTLFVLLLNAVSSGLIPLSPDISALYVLRIAQGLSEGLTIPLLMTTALRALDPPIRLYGLAVYALTATFTPALATTVAALWTDLVDWRFVFFAAVPLCAVGGVMVWYGDPQDSPQYERFRFFDWCGALLVLIGLGSFSTLLQQGDRLDWFNSPLICLLALVSVIAIPLLVLNEWFHKLPLLKLQFLGRRNLAYAFVALFTFLIIAQSGSAVPNDFLREIQGYRPEQAYLITLEIAVSQLVLLPALALVLDYPRVDARVIGLIGLILILVSCIGASFVTTDWYRNQFYLWQALQAIGQPMVVMPLLLLATNSVRGADEAPFASALINTPRALSEATAIWLVQLVQHWRGGLHYNRLVDEIGQRRFQVIQSPELLSQQPPPLLPDGRPRAPGSLDMFRQAVEQQARILTISDLYLVLAAICVALILVVLILPERTLPPRLQLAKK